MSSMIAETIEYSEVKTGRRCEAITFSGQTFMGKLSAAVAGSLTGLILVAIGYVPEAAYPVSADTERLVHGCFSASCSGRHYPSCDSEVLYLH